MPYFVANLFRTLCMNFCQNQLSFERYDKNILAYFVLRHIVVGLVLGEA